jgi:phosphate transport system protein
MSEKFHTELDELQTDVINMGHLALRMLRKAVRALKNQDVRLAEEVLAVKDDIARKDFEIEGKALHLIALHQPMAVDMRMIACILKMITYLTRIGRYAKDIAKITKALAARPQVAKLVTIPYMGERVSEMIEDSLKAFETKDVTLIDKFKERDDEIDGLRYSILREYLTYMMENQKNITSCTFYIIIAHYLERCGDHACKMAEKIHYMITGEHIEIDVK